MEKVISIVESAAKEETELWDGYNEDGSLAGCDLVRGEKLPEGLRHAVAEVFVMHTDGTILLMQRDKRKPNSPGFWESGAGGSVIKGESFLDGAKRELFEETGIVADNLEEIYHVVTASAIYQGYFCLTDIDKQAIRLQEGETIDFRWVDKQEYLNIFESDVLIDSQKKRLQDFIRHDFKKETDCSFKEGNYLFRYRAAAIIIENGAILMAANDIDDYYYSIGGGVHLGETSEQAAVREAFEETGVHYEVERLAFINECFFCGSGTLEGKECHGIELYYLMKPRGTRELNSNSVTHGVKEHMHWLPIDELQNYKLFPAFFKEKLAHLPDGIEHIVSDELRVN